ncbi:hypothetical protein CYMTET_3153 [Cymbomonas tetramitiformis]|uniref:Uncharacterized protein n=1 Tax=Cymbomonas tetramitiformis TaxID=36881 RepID=A0AAE0H3S8_9CHLO|nr:hypothetical protein CYMTET_3153 [Cymbomonas tetramitiformis]
MQRNTPRSERGADTLERGCKRQPLDQTPLCSTGLQDGGKWPWLSLPTGRGSLAQRAVDSGAEGGHPVAEAGSVYSERPERTTQKCIWCSGTSLGTKIEVHWRNGSAFYPGVAQHYTEEGQAFVRYDDGDEGTLDLTEEFYWVQTNR